jgi:hypothetical protein
MKIILMPFRLKLLERWTFEKVLSFLFTIESPVSYYNLRQKARVIYSRKDKGFAYSK